MDKTDDLKIGTRRSYWNEAKARGIVAAWQQSGETLAAFARRLGVNRKRLRRWASRLGVREPKAIRFHPVQVRERASGLLAAAIEIDLGAKCCIRVPRGFGAEDLRRVLAVFNEVTPC